MIKLMLLKHLRLSNHTIWWYNLQSIHRFSRSIYLRPNITKSFIKVIETELAKIFLTDRRGTVAYLKIYDEVTEYTRQSFRRQSQLSKLRYDRHTNFYARYANALSDEHQENSAASSRRVAPMRYLRDRNLHSTTSGFQVTLSPEGWNWKWGWFEYTFCLST